MALRIATAGSVDDGKSTLIGRLLHDSKTVFEDQLRAVERASKRYGDGTTNLALLTDGLRAEREQGITIDVAYRYFATPQRTFVVADTPGHAQYTRNMVTGASVSDVVIVLVDVRVGPTEQTWRHLFIASLLGIRQIVLAVNKIDLVDYDDATYNAVVAQVLDHAQRLPYPVDVVAIPVSALNGDNVVDRGDNTAWYSGDSLLGHLEGVEVDQRHDQGARLPVQWIIRPHGQEFHDYRGVAGRLTGGSLAVGDEVVVLPSGERTRVSAIDRGGEAVDLALPTQSISVQLEDDVDVGRGDVLVSASAASRPVVASEFEADVCWMTDRALEPNSRWALKHTTRSTRAIVTDIVARYDVETADTLPADRLVLNDLGRVRIATMSPLVVDPYESERQCGSAILVDESSGATVGALMIRNTGA